MTQILDYAKPAEEFDKESFRFKVALGGKSGSGKTTSAVLTLPGKKLLLDYDGRSESIAGYPDVEVIKEPLLEPNPKSPVAWQRAEKLIDELWASYRKGELKYDAVIEDGLTMMNRICMYWALLLDPKRGLGGSPAEQHYGPQMKNLADHILKMKALPVHYVLTFHLELFESKKEGAIMYLPKMYGKTRTEIGSWFNECYLCFHKAGEKGEGEKYYWHTGGFGRYDFFKSALNNPVGRYWKDPLEIDLSRKTCGFKEILERRFGNVPEESPQKNGEVN